MPIYDIRNYYSDGKTPSLTGHKVFAESEERALEIAERHGIGYPFNRPVRKRRISGIITPLFLHSSRSSVWFEDEAGKLKGVPCSSSMAKEMCSE